MGRGPSILPRSVWSVWSGAQARCLLLRRVCWAPGTSAAKPGRESTAGDMWRPVRTPPPHALDPGSDSAFRVPELGSISVPGGSGSNPGPGPARRLYSFGELSDSRFLFFPRAFGKTQHHLTLPLGPLPPDSVLSTSLGSPREAVLYSLSASGRETTP